MTRRRVFAVWTATRLLLLTMLVAGTPKLFSDLRLYEKWGNGIADWTTLPYRDFAWEYPPGAAVVITPPAFFGSWYVGVFIGLMVLADLAVVVVLTRLARVLGSDRGVWLWIAGVTFIGPIVYARYDTVSALLAVLAVLGLATGAPFAAGLALGGGVVTKLWPAVLAVALPFVQGARRVLAGAAVVVGATVVTVLAIGGANHGGATFERHTDRGLQVESLVATPVVVMQRAGAAVDISFHPESGSWDVTGTGAAAALTASTFLTLLALGVVGWLVWRVRRAPELWPDLVATSLLLVAVTGKVLSPQYVIWLVALFAAALCRRGSPLLAPAALIAGTAVLGQVVYPTYYIDLVNGGGSVVVVALVLRNLALAVAAVLAVVTIHRCTATP